MKVIEGNIAAPEARVAIVVARFNSFINESLVDGAVDVLKRQGQVQDSNLTLVRVPGAVEIPWPSRSWPRVVNMTPSLRWAPSSVAAPITSIWWQTRTARAWPR